MISVCVPAYENAISFSRTLATILLQRNCELEVIVTDDSRSDVVCNVIDNYRADPRIHYFRNPKRLGAVRNWNYALSLARGQVKKLLHHDDWLDGDNALAELAAPILDGKADAVFCSCKAIGNSGLRFVHKISPATEHVLKQRPERLVFGNLVGGPSVSAVSANIPVYFDPQYLWMSDVDYYIRLLKIPGVRLAILDDPLVCISMELETQITRLFERNQRLAAKELFSLVEREYGNESLPVADRQYLLNALHGCAKRSAVWWLIDAVLGRRRMESRYLFRYLCKGER